MNVPPWWRANAQENSAVRAPPMWRNPVGDGAKRVRTVGSDMARRRVRPAVRRVGKASDSSRSADRDRPFVRRGRGPCDRLG
jgi:hypothetical protein